MSFPQSAQKACPLLRRLLYDAFQTDTFLLTWPYENIEQIDRSIRKTLWGDSFLTFKGFPMLTEHIPFARAVIFKSSLGFYNIICLLSDTPHPDLISVGPFRDQQVTPEFLLHLVQENHLTDMSLSVLQNFYTTLPMADPDAVASFICHFLGVFLPDYENVVPSRVNFSETDQSILPDEDLISAQTNEYAEQYADGYLQITEAIRSGRSDDGIRCLRSWLSLTGMLKEPRLPRLCRNLTVLNELFASAVLSSPVPPVSVRKLADELQFEIDSASGCASLRLLPESMLVKYCTLVKNQSHAGYSALTGQIMNYVLLHLSDDLSLSEIARVFGRHPSALSSYFRRETDMTLTSYIRRERIRRAAEYLSISSLEIREIAFLTGFHDLGYFSRIFKKQMKMTPGTYRKMFAVPRNTSSHTEKS